MEDLIISFFSKFDIQNIISLIIIMWFFTRNIKISIDQLDVDIREMNSRVSRLEGTVYGKNVYKEINK